MAHFKSLGLHKYLFFSINCNICKKIHLVTVAGIWTHDLHWRVSSYNHWTSALGLKISQIYQSGSPEWGEGKKLRVRPPGLAFVPSKCLASRRCCSNDLTKVVHDLISGQIVQPDYPNEACLLATMTGTIVHLALSGPEKLVETKTARKRHEKLYQIRDCSSNGSLN